VVQSRSSDAGGQTAGCEMAACRLVLTRNAHSELLLVENCSDFHLPAVEIPRWERAAPHLTSHVLSRWGVKAVVLFHVRSESVASDSGEVCYYVLGSIDANAPLIRGARWMPTGDLRDKRVYQEDTVLRQALHQAETYDNSDRVATFVHSGWLDELNSWMRTRLSTCGWRLTGECTQYAIGPWFCLLRCATNGPYIWFKAVGGPNSREYAITRLLTEFASPFLPEILGTRDDWRGWLSLEAIGQHLDQVWDLASWQSAARSLAQLQLTSLPNADSLLTAGTKDLRLEKLASLICPLFDRIAKLMRQQPSSPPRILTMGDLNSLTDRLQNACTQLEKHGLPAALGHADLNPGNVIVDGERTVFLDWAEATISHPFFTFEYLIAVLRRLRPDLECWVEELRQAYSAPWREFFSNEQVMKAFELTPLLAVLAFAAGCTDWNGSGEDIRPPMAKLMRALARRMQVEALRLDRMGI
jgi:hypothetical protein